MRRSLTALVSVAFVGGLVGRGLRYGFNIVIARGVGIEALGVFAFGMVLMKGGGVVARVGLDDAVQKYIPVYRNENDPARVSGTVVLCLLTPLAVGSVLAGVLYLSRDYINELFNSSFVTSIELFLIGIPLFATMMVGVSATFGLKETKYSVYVRDFGQSGIALVSMAIGAFFLSSLVAVVLGYLFSLLVGICLAVVFLFRNGALKVNIRPIFEHRELYVFALPLTFAASTQYLVSWTDVFVLGIFAPPAAVGWYQAAYQTSVLLLVILQATNSIFPALAADLSHNGHKKRLKRVYSVVTKWIVYLTILGFSFVVVYADEILGIFGTTVPSAKNTLIILALGQVLAASVGPAGYLLAMADYERVEMANATVMSVLNIILNLILVKVYGIIGAAVATATSLAVLNVLRMVEVWYLLRIQPYSFKYWKGFVAVFGALSLMWLGRGMALPSVVQVACIGILSLSTFAALLWFLGFDEIDRILVEEIN